MKKVLGMAAFVFLLQAALSGSAMATLIFDNGQDNSFSSVSSVPVVVQDSTGGVPTHLDVFAGADVDDPGGPGGINGDTAMEIHDYSTANIYGGVFRQDLDAEDFSLVNIFGGEFQDDIWAFAHSTINFYDGSVADDMELVGQSTVNVFDGSFGEDVQAYDRSTVTLFGGVYSGDVEAKSFAMLNIYGGTFEPGLPGDDPLLLEASGAAVITIYGSEFQIDGLDVSDGAISASSGKISGILSDGSFIAREFERSNQSIAGELMPGVPMRGTIVLVTIPEPTSCVLASSTGLICCILFGRRKRSTLIPAP